MEVLEFLCNKSILLCHAISVNEDSIFSVMASTILVVFWSIFTIISLAGLFTNIFTIVVFTRPQMSKSAFYTILLGIAVFDVIIALSDIYVSTRNIANLNIVTQTSSEARVRFDILLYALVNIAATATTCLTLVASIERYLVICRPETGKIFFTQKRAMIAVLAVTGLSLFLNITRFLEVYDIHSHIIKY